MVGAGERYLDFLHRCSPQLCVTHSRVYLELCKKTTLSNLFPFFPTQENILECERKGSILLQDVLSFFSQGAAVVKLVISNK